VSSQARVSGEVRVLFRPGCAFVEGVNVAVFADGGTRRGSTENPRVNGRPADALGYSKMLALTGVFYQRAGNECADVGAGARTVSGNAHCGRR